MEEQRSGRGGVVLLLIAVVVVGALVASLTVANADARPHVKPAHVVEWPSSVAPIAHSVEEIRGLRFHHSVRIRHVSVPTGSTPPVDAQTRSALETALQPLVTFGLVSSDNDVATLVSTASGPPAGAYNPDTGHIRIFVPTGDAFGHAVLAHELTHALEDQNYPEGDRRTPRMATDVVVSKGVVEGSASRVERLYVHEQWKAPFLRHGRRADVDLGSSPEVRKWEWFAALGIAPYALGPEYIDMRLAEGDLDWDRVISIPPASDVAIVDPLAPPSTSWRVVGNPSPSFREPSALEIFLLLASRVDPAAALDAMERSSGSMLTTYQREGRPCSDLTLLTRTPDDPTVTATLDAWIASAGPTNASRAALPSGSQVVIPTSRPSNPPAMLRLQAGSPVLTSCRGASTVPFGSFGVPLALLVGRNDAAARAVRHRYDDAATGCIVRGVFSDELFRSELHEAVESQEHISIKPSRHAYRRAVTACDTGA